MSETTPLIPASLLYRFSTDCRRFPKKWSDSTGVSLAPEYRLPTFSQLDERQPYADVRVAWSDQGMFFNLSVEGKRQSIWCRETQLTESDAFQVWIDTRDTHNVHRANRFCHWFLFLPTGCGAKRNEPLATMLKINRAKEDPKTLNQVPLRLKAQVKPNGYKLSAWVSNTALTGWNPSEHRKIGFNYAVVDRELGWQPFSIGSEFPVTEDPSLWQTLDLVG